MKDKSIWYGVLLHVGKVGRGQLCEIMFQGQQTSGFTLQ
jgi:hypothetical protein